MFFKLAYLPMKLSFSGNICFKNINSSSTKTLLFKQKHDTCFLSLIIIIVMVELQLIDILAIDLECCAGFALIHAKEGGDLICTGRLFQIILAQ